MTDVLFEVPIAAAPETVYEAITTQNGLARWWTPDVSAQPEAGSIAEFRFRGGQYVAQMKIVRLERPARVEWAVKRGAPEWAGTSITFDLSPAGNGTTLRFGHRDYPSTEGLFANVSFNWAWYLISLKDYLEKGQGRQCSS